MFCTYIFIQAGVHFVDVLHGSSKEFKNAETNLLHLLTCESAQQTFHFRLIEYLNDKLDFSLFQN